MLSDLRVRTAVCILALCGAAATLPLAAAAAPQQPNPTPLWKQYPLDSSRSGRSPEPRPASKPRARSAPAHSSGGHGLVFWFALGWGIVLLGALAWVLAFARIIRRRPARETAPAPAAPSASAAPSENGVTAALRDVIRASEERAAPKPTQASKLTRLASSADQVEKLKQKAVRPAAKDAGLREVSVLKAKLGVSLEQACHIEWSAGADESQFLAKVRKDDGSESVVASSPPFKWDEPTPPPTSLPRAVKAHAVLVHDLKQAGWKTIGRGEDWYSLELQRRSLVAAREGEA